MGEDQAGGHALTHDALEEPAESAAFPEATMAVLRERGMIRNGIFQTKPAEPAIGEIEVDFLTHLRDLESRITSLVESQQADGSGRLIVSRLPSAEQDDFTGLESVAEGRVFSVNPLDFYGEDKIRLLVERFLWSPVFESYGAPIERLPSGSLAWLTDNHIGVVDGGSWYLLYSLSAQDRARFDAWLPAAGLNAVTQAKMSCTTQQLEALTTCRHCGALASFRPRDGAFKAECASCKTEWGIYSTSSGRVARMRTADQNEVSFVRFGSWSIEFRLD